MDHHPAGHPAGSLPCSEHNTERHDALSSVLRWLRCPHCAAPLHSAAQRALSCASGHSFDIARHGYVSLLAGRRPHSGDGPAMIAAREEFLGLDHYRPLRSTITALAAEHAPDARSKLVADLAGGPGYYLAPVLDTLPAAHGLVIDVSTSALRRAARVHPRAAAITADLRSRLPVASGCVSLALSIFGPRPAAEIARLLRPDGVLTVASAGTGHLRELRSRLGVLGVDPHEVERMRRAFSDFEVLDEVPVHWRLALDQRDVVNLVGMGPSGHHLDSAAVQAAVSGLPDTVGVTAVMTVTALRPRQRAALSG